jgi:hypothetical protein
MISFRHSLKCDPRFVATPLTNLLSQYQEWTYTRFNHGHHNSCTLLRHASLHRVEPDQPAQNSPPGPPLLMEHLRGNRRIAVEHSCTPASQIRSADHERATVLNPPLAARASARKSAVGSLANGAPHLLHLLSRPPTHLDLPPRTASRRNRPKAPQQVAWQTRQRKRIKHPTVLQ